MTSDEQGYNGWKNYPTWDVNLWLGNDEGLYALATRAAEECNNSETRRVDMADWLKDFVRSTFEPDSASMASDLLGWAFDCVDWFAIADALLEQVSELEGSAR